MTQRRILVGLSVLAALSAVSCKRLFITQDAPAEAEPAAPSAERPQSPSVTALLQGAASASALPVSYEEPGLPFDPRLRTKLSTAVEEAEGEVKVRLDPLTVSDGLPREVVLRILRRQLPMLRMCASTESKQKRAFAGTIMVSFVINTNGTVSKATKQSATIENEALSSCLLKRLSSMVYPAPSGDPVTVSVPVVFSD